MHSQRSLLALSLILGTARANEKKAAQMTRRGLIITLLAIGVALDLLISVALVYSVRQARDAASEVRIVKVAAYEACLVNNERSAADLKRWNDILDLVQNGPNTPGRDQFVAAVNKANQQADNPRDCGRLVP